MGFEYEQWTTRMGAEGLVRQVADEAFRRVYHRDLMQTRMTGDCTVGSLQGIGNLIQ